MQETHFGSVNNMRDALLVIEAARTGLLPRIKQRPGSKEKDFIRSGSVYVWDEEESGIRRWTDNRKWSSSRTMGDFVGYVEMVDNSRMQPPSYNTREPLHKKVMSFETSDGRRYHLAAYYSITDLDNGVLMPPNPSLVQVETGYYRRLRQNRDVQAMTHIYSKTFDSASNGANLNSIKSFGTNQFNLNLTESHMRRPSNDLREEISPGLPSVSTLFDVADKGNPKVHLSSPSQSPDSFWYHRR